MFIGVTSGFERLGSLGVVAAKRQRFLPLFSGGGLLLNVTLSILALRSDFGLQGVAGAALISNAMFGIATMALLAGLAKATKPVTYLLRMVFPLTWCLMSVLVLGNFCIEPKFTSCLGSFGLYVLAILPLVPGALSEMRKLR
jgi:Na+-driven multidrug efflux pump